MAGEATSGAQEDWGHILVLCDEVSKGGSAACSETIKAIVKRLRTNNANTQMQALTVSYCLSARCCLCAYLLL